MTATHSASVTSIQQPAEHRCEVCGEAMGIGAGYRARDDEGGGVHVFPSRECGRCGFICPDVCRIEEMAPESIPSSVRLRCARPASANVLPEVTASAVGTPLPR